jgi:hypothetical protein
MKKEVGKSNYDFTDNVVTVLLWYVNSVLTLLSLKKLDPIKQATRDSGNSLILSHHSACPHTRVLSSLTCGASPFYSSGAGAVLSMALPALTWGCWLAGHLALLAFRQHNKTY